MLASSIKRDMTVDWFDVPEHKAAVSKVLASSLKRESTADWFGVHKSSNWKREARQQAQRQMTADWFNDISCEHNARQQHQDPTHTS